MIPVAAVAILKAVAGGVGKVLHAIPPMAWLGLAALLAAYLYGEARHADGVQEERTAQEAARAKEADQAAAFVAEQNEAARIREQALSDQLLQAQSDHAKALHDAQVRADRTVADLRAGNLRLRQHWKACLSRPDPTAGDPEGTDDAAYLRAADIGRVQRIAGTCDADVKFWQDTWNAVQQAVNQPGE